MYSVCTNYRVIIQCLKVRIPQQNASLPPGIYFEHSTAEQEKKELIVNFDRVHTLFSDQKSKDFSRAKF